MAERQHAGIDMATQLLAGSIAAIQGTTHQCAMRQDCTLRSTRRATREENGSRVVLVDGGHRSGMVGTVGDGDGLAGHTGDAFSKVLAVGDDFHAKLHATAHHGLGRQLRRQVDGHEARRSGGEKHFDGINVGVVQDGHLVAFLQAKVVEQGAFACHYVAYLLVAECVHRVGKARQVSPLLLNPSDKFRKGRDVL